MSSNAAVGVERERTTKKTAEAERKVLFVAMFGSMLILLLILVA